MKFYIKSTIALFGVLLGIITPVTLEAGAANAAAPTVTRVIQVLDPSSAPASGVSVAMYLNDYVVPLNGHMTNVAITNAQGIATFQVPGSASWGEVLVQPETSTGWATRDDGVDLNPTVSIDTVTVTLRAAKYFLTVNNPSGGVAADSGTIIVSPIGINPNNGRVQRDFIRVVNPNKPVGIAYDDAALGFNRANLFLAVRPKYDMDCYGLAGNIYSLLVHGTDSITAINPLDPSDVATQSGNTFVVKLGTPNLSGTLLTNSGNPLNLSPESSAQMYLLNMADSTTPASTQYLQSGGSPACVKSDGTWSTRVFDISQSSGNYRIAFSIQDSNTSDLALPTFISDSVITVSASTNLSLNGGSTSSSISGISIRAPQKQMTLHFSDNGITKTSDAYIQRVITNGNQQQNIFLADVITSNGYISFNLPDGDYQVDFNEWSGQYKANPVQFSIQGGRVGVTDFQASPPVFTEGSIYSGKLISPSGNPLNTYEIPLSAPNFKFTLVDDSANPISSAWISAGPVQNQTDWPNNWSSSTSPDGVGNGGLSLDAGFMYRIRIDLDYSFGLAAVQYWATVDTATGNITVVSDDGQPVTFDNATSRFILKAHTANLLAVVTDPVTQAPLSGNTQAYLVVCVENGPCNGQGVDYAGFANYKLQDGTYILRVGQNGSSYAESSYPITVSGGIVSFTGTTPPKSGNRFILSPATSNFTARLVSPVDTSAALSQSWLEVNTLDSNGNINGGTGRGTDSQGNISLNLSDGNYILKVHPASNSPFAVSSFNATVSNGQVTVSGASQSGQTWILPAAQPNLSGTISLSSGALTFGQNQGISIQVQKWNPNNNNWDWVNQNGYFTSTTYSMNVTRGQTDVAQFVKYRLQINPRGFSDLSPTASEPFYIASNGKISLTENIDSATNSISNFNLVINTANLKLDVKNPLDNSALTRGWVNVEILNSDSSTSWVTNSGLDPAFPGKASFSLPTDVDKNYMITVNPPEGNQAIAGLAAKRYIARVVSGVLTLTTYSGGSVPTSSGRYQVSPGSANVTGTLFTGAGSPVGTTQNSWAWVSVEKWSNLYNNWQGTNLGSRPSAAGVFSLAVTEPGDYRLRIETSGRDDTALTYSDSFTIVSESSQFNFNHLTLNSPSLRIKLIYPDDAGTLLTNYGVEIRQNNQWIGWANSNGSTTVPIALPSAGTYQITVNPPWNSSRSGFSKKTYEVVATGSPVTGSVTGVVPVSGIYTLSLAAATFSGRVFTPTDTATGVANAQVVPVDVTTGREYWEYGTNTNQSGAFSISVPDGSYSLVAKAPWGTSLYGASLPTSTFVVSGGSTTNGTGLSLSLRAPRWSGTLRSPDGASTIAFASVCFQANISTPWTCTNTDSNGRWALSEPSGFTSFDDYSVLEVRENNNAQYSPVRYQGVDALNTALGSGADTITILLKAPNTQITVLTPGGAPVANAWVNLDRDNFGWLGGSNTDANGVAKFNIELSGGAFNLNADISNTKFVGAYTAPRTSFTSGQVTSGTDVNGIFRGTLTLVEPNLKGVLTDPQDSNKPVPYSWVELFNDSTNQWMGGANTDSTGFFAMNIPNSASGTDSYTLNVNPQWNSTSSSGRQAYTASIGTTGAPTLTVKKNGNSLSTTTKAGVSGTIYRFELSTPSVTGVVRDANGNALMNSWVVPVDSATGEYLWQQGTNSRSNGAFSLSLANGSYQLEANVPWGTSGQARSARCTVTVSGDSMISNSCSETGTATLRLRSPNLTITLNSPTDLPVFNANVGIGYQNWNTWAQSSRDGRVSFFIDPLTIQQATGSSNGSLHLWIDPPYGTSEMVRIECNSGDVTCSAIPPLDGSASYTTTSTTLKFAAPNTRVRVLDPSGTPVSAGAWVAVFNTTADGYRIWVAGSNTDSNGYAAFNIDTATNTNLIVEVNAPYNKRDLYSTKTYDSSSVLNDGQLPFGANGINGYSFRLQAPNLIITSKTPLGAANNKWGWISVEESLTGTSNYSWVGGYGLDDRGRISVTLAASKIFRVTVNPGPGKTGSRTSCILETDANSVVTVLDCPTISESSTANNALSVTINMDEGNVVGTVYASDSVTPVAGAIVYANLMLDATTMSTDPATKVTTVSGSNGRYGLNLDISNGQTWGIRVIPASNPNLAVTNFINFAIPSNGDFDLILDAKP